MLQYKFYYFNNVLSGRYYQSRDTQNSLRHCREIVDINNTAVIRKTDVTDNFQENELHTSSESEKSKESTSIFF